MSTGALTATLAQWDGNGRCPIHAAVVVLNTGAVQALLDLSPMTRDVRTADGQTALTLATRVHTAARDLSDAGDDQATARLTRAALVLRLLS